MKKIFIATLILIVSCTYLFVQGVFNPKEIYIDELKIVAPRNMILSSVSVDYKNVQNYFSPLLFQNKNKYSLSSSKNISFDFSRASRTSKIPSIIVRLTTDITPERYLGIFQGKSQYKEMQNKECLIYQYEKKDFFVIYVLHKTKKVKISISSSKQSSTIEILKQFCPQKGASDANATNSTSKLGVR